LLADVAAPFAAPGTCSIPPARRCRTWTNCIRAPSGARTI